MPYVSSTATTFKGGGQALSFKCGSQAALEPYIKGAAAGGQAAVDGTFYLTNDTSRLYVGNNGKAVPVNQGVITVANIASLPTPGEAGQFYYAESENVLAVWSGRNDSDGVWVQINNNTDTVVDSVTNTVTAITDGVSVETKVGSTNNQTKEDTFELVGSNGVTVSRTDDDTISISGTGATLSSDGAVVSLGGDPHSGSVTFEGDGSLVTVEGNGANKIKISVDDSDHVQSEAFSNEDTGFKHTTTFKGQDSIESTVDPIIKLDAEGSEIHFEKGVATLGVYSKDEIDDFLQGVNAMHYKGTITGVSGAVVSDGIIASVTGITGGQAAAQHKIGDTYAASQNIELTVGDDNYEIKAGSLFIATGTEGADGYITSESLEFNIINESFEADTRYELITESVTGGGKATLKEANSSRNPVGSFEVIGDGDVVGSHSNGKVTLSHKTYDAIDVDGNGESTLDKGAIIKVVTGIESNTTGHLTKVETTDISVGDFDTTISSDEITTTVANNVATVAHNLTLSTGDRTSTDSGAFDLKSDTLTFTDADGDTNQGIKIDMVWGTF